MGEMLWAQGLPNRQMSPVWPVMAGAGALDEILPRKNQFYRPAVANIDQLVIMASEAIPVTDPFLIDRVAAIAEHKGCECVICINKCDLASGEALEQIYTAAGFPTLPPRRPRRTRIRIPCICISYCPFDLPETIGKARGISSQFFRAGFCGAGRRRAKRRFRRAG